MSGDIMFANGRAFLLVIFQPINYIRVEPLAARTVKELYRAIIKVRAHVTRYGVRVPRLLFDQETSVMSEELIQACGVQLDPINTSNKIDEPRTTGALALHATGNLRNSWYFLVIKTWEIVRR
jgi:hypothetical protein